MLPSPPDCPLPFKHTSKQQAWLYPLSAPIIHSQHIQPLPSLGTWLWNFKQWLLTQVPRHTVAIRDLHVDAVSWQPCYSASRFRPSWEDIKDTTGTDWLSCKWLFLLISQPRCCMRFPVFTEIIYLIPKYSQQAKSSPRGSVLGMMPIAFSLIRNGFHN